MANNYDYQTLYNILIDARMHIDEDEANEHEEKLVEALVDAIDALRNLF